MRRASGYTLIELMIAATMGLIVIGGAFATLTGMQRVAGKQAASNELVAAGRIAMEVMARDIRSAGDSMALLPSPCLEGQSFLPTSHLCPAIHDAHPWRIAIARNAWVDANGDGSTFSLEDTPPPVGRLFEQGTDNVVVYQFVPDTDSAQNLAGTGGTRTGWLGRLERVVNPFGFNGEDPRVTVLLDRVLLDDRMRVDPANETTSDARFDHSLFMYRLLTRQNELQGDPEVVSRNTSFGQLFLSPPIRFFQVGPPASYTPNRPWTPAYPAQVVGLRADGSAVASLFSSGLASLNPAPADPTTSALRLVLDRNRIRAVRIAFKIVDDRERPGTTDGIDLDGNPANGVAPVYMFETTVELKPLVNYYAEF